MAKASRCDRCGKYFPVKHGSNVLQKIRILKYISLTCRNCTQEFDLCDDCMKSFSEWMNEPKKEWG